MQWGDSTKIVIDNVLIMSGLKKTYLFYFFSIQNTYKTTNQL